MFLAPMPWQGKTPTCCSLCFEIIYDSNIFKECIHVSISTSSSSQPSCHAVLSDTPTGTLSRILIVSHFSGACGNSLRRPLGSLPQHIPKHLAPRHHRHLHRFLHHHQAGPHQVAEPQMHIGTRVPGTCLAFLPQKNPGCLAPHVVALFPAFFLPSQQLFFFPLLASTMHTSTVVTTTVNKYSYHLYSFLTVA